jgi:hypothetical protein
MYFDNCASAAEVKAAYKKLAKLHHPDVGGSTKTMQQINAEFAKVYAFYSGKEVRASKVAENGEKAHYDQYTSAEFQQKLSNAINVIFNANIDRIDGVLVELIGTWIWISGAKLKDLPHVRAILKDTGFQWNSAKKTWSYTPGKRISFRTNTDMEYKRNRYGSTVLNRTMSELA